MWNGNHHKISYFYKLLDAFKNDEYLITDEK